MKLLTLPRSRGQVFRGSDGTPACVSHSPAADDPARLQPQQVGDGPGQGVAVVGDIDEARCSLVAKGLHPAQYLVAVGEIQALAGLIQDEQLRPLDQGTRYQDQSLLSFRNRAEPQPGDLREAQPLQPGARCLVLLR